MAHAARTRTRPEPEQPSGDPRPETVGALLRRLGVRADRVRLRPPPGSATERDLLDARGRKDGLCELVDGTLVDKAMGFDESRLALRIAYFLLDFLRRHDLGVVAGADGPVRLGPGLVRLPDLAFVGWGRIPGRKLPLGPVLRAAPDLAVEVLSKGNTRQEMRRKLAEYFGAGVRLVWLVDPRAKAVRVHIAPGESTLVELGGVLDGGDVLPGFALPLDDLFAPAWPGGDA